MELLNAQQHVQLELIKISKQIIIYAQHVPLVVIHVIYLLIFIGKKFNFYLNKGTGSVVCTACKDSYYLTANTCD